MRDAMPDPHPTPLAQPRAPRGAPGIAGRAEAPPSARVPADGDVARPAVREAVRRAAAEEARARLADARRFGSAEGSDRLAEPPPEVRRLLARMESSVAGYVRARRAAGVTVERVLPEVKCLVREAESCEGWRDPSDALLAHAVRWSIETYYDAPALRHVPSFY